MDNNFLKTSLIELFTRLVVVGLALVLILVVIGISRGVLTPPFGYQGTAMATAAVWVEVPLFNWEAEYFDNPDLEGKPVFEREDWKIDFSWGVDGPEGVNRDGEVVVLKNNFSVHWETGPLDLDTGIYRCQVIADDRVRIWITNQLVVDQ